MRTPFGDHVGDRIGDRKQPRVHAKLTAPRRERERRRAGGGREKARGRLPAWQEPRLWASLPARVVRGRAGRRHDDADTSASTLYKDALATTHAWSVHYDSSSTESKPDAGRERRRRTGLGQPDRHHGPGHHHHPRDRWHLLRQGQRRRPRDPGRAQHFPSRRGSRTVDRVLDRQHGLRPGGRRRPFHRHGQGAGTQGPALPRAGRARSTASRSTPSTGPRPSARSPSTSSSMCGPGEPTFPWRRTR